MSEDIVQQLRRIANTDLSWCPQGSPHHCEVAADEIERLRKVTQVIESIRNFAQNVRGDAYLHNNVREIRYIDDLSQALLNLLEGNIVKEH